MSNPAKDIADAVATVINAGSWSQAVTAARRWAPRKDLEELDDVAIDVIPFKMEPETQARGGSVREVYSIALDAKVRLTPASAQSETDALVDLLFEIADDFRTTRQLAAVPGATCLAPAIDAFAVPEQYHKNVFRGILRLRFTIGRA